MATPKRFILQGAFDDIWFKDLSTGKILAHLYDLKTNGLEDTIEMVYATGGRGNVYIGRGFGHSRRATLNVENAVFDLEAMALQNGEEVITSTSDTANAEGSFTATKCEIITVKKGTTTASTTYNALGTAGAEIGTARVIDVDGSFGDALTQGTGSSLAANTFTYTKKTLTFSADFAKDSDKMIAISYTFTANIGSHKLVTNADSLPAYVGVVAVGSAADDCTGELYPMQIEGRAQLDGNRTMDLSADGDPAVHNLNLEFTKGCTSKELYTIEILADGE